MAPSKTIILFLAIAFLATFVAASPFYRVGLVLPAATDKVDPNVDRRDQIILTESSSSASVEPPQHPMPGSPHGSCPGHPAPPNVTDDCARALHDIVAARKIRLACTPKPPASENAPEPVMFETGEAKSPFDTLYEVIGLAAARAQSARPSMTFAKRDGPPGGGCSWRNRTTTFLNAYCSDECGATIKEYFSGAESACGKQILIPARVWHHMTSEESTPATSSEGRQPVPNAAVDVALESLSAFRPAPVNPFESLTKSVTAFVDSAMELVKSVFEKDDDEEDEHDEEERKEKHKEEHDKHGRRHGRRSLRRRQAPHPPFHPGPHPGPGEPHPPFHGPHPPFHPDPHMILFPLIHLANNKENLTASDIHALFGLTRAVKCSKAEPTGDEKEAHYCPISARIMLDQPMFFPHPPMRGPPHGPPGGPHPPMSPPHGMPPAHGMPGGGPRFGPPHAEGETGMEGGHRGWMKKRDFGMGGLGGVEDNLWPGMPHWSPKEICSCATATSTALKDNAKGLRKDLLKPWIVPRAEYLKIRGCSYE